MGRRFTQFDELANLPHITAMAKVSLIIIDPQRRSGKPCVRDTRITVYDVLEYLASGMSKAEIIADFSELTKEDIRSTLTLARTNEKRI